MALVLDIFAPQKSSIAEGLVGKIMMIYGGNNLGKTAQSVKFPKPLVLAAENGLNGIDGVPFLPITRWSDFKKVINQLTSPATKDKAREAYSTIIIDEVYATSIYCQDYVCQTYGDGALTMADGDSKHNLYQLYEKEYFRQINALTNAGYTIVFIAHQQENTQTHFISPKGDKRCMNPIIDKCDYVIYLKSNGVDSDNRVIKSSAYLAQTNEFFARSRIEYTPTFIKEFTVENLTEAIQLGIDKKRELEGAKIVTFEEQQKTKEVAPLNFDGLMAEFKEIVNSIPGHTDINGDTEEGKKFNTFWGPNITQIIEKHLGKDMKMSQCTSNQVEAVALIVDELKSFVEEHKSK